MKKFCTGLNNFNKIFWKYFYKTSRTKVIYSIHPLEILV